MGTVSKLCMFFLALTCIEALPAFASAQDPKIQISAEIERLQESLRATSVSDPDFSSLGSEIGRLLKEAADALNSGKPYLSLEKLLQAEDFLQSLRVVEEKSAAVKSGLPACEA